MELQTIIDIINGLGRGSYAEPGYAEIMIGNDWYHTKLLFDPAELEPLSDREFDKFIKNVSSFGKTFLKAVSKTSHITVATVLFDQISYSSGARMTVELNWDPKKALLDNIILEAGGDVDWPNVAIKGAKLRQIINPGYIDSIADVVYRDQEAAALLDNQRKAEKFIEKFALEFLRDYKVLKPNVYGINAKTAKIWQKMIEIIDKEFGEPMLYRGILEDIADILMK